MVRVMETGWRWLAMLVASSLVGWDGQQEVESPEPDASTEASAPEGDGAAEADAFALDVGSPAKAGRDALTGDDASAEDASDATLDSGSAEGGDAPKGGDTGVALDAGDAASGVVISTSGFGDLPVNCNSPLLSQSFVVSNPTSGALTWTSSVTSTGAAPAPSLTPNTSTLAPGASVMVTVAYPLATNPGHGTIAVTISDGISDQSIKWSETVNGYTASASGPVDFGSFPAGRAIAATSNFQETISVSTTATNVASPCQFVSLSGGGTGTSVAFSAPTACEAALGPAQWNAQISVQLTAPASTPPGTYVGTFSLGSASLDGTLCNGPVTFTATVTLVAPVDAGTADSGETADAAGTGAEPLTGVASLAASALNACALLSTGTVECWGDDEYGQLGNTTSVKDTCVYGVNTPTACSTTP